MKKADYIYAVASIRVKEKSLLTDADVQTMCGMKSEGEVLSFLTERGWGNGGNSQNGKDMDTVLSEEDAAQMRLLKSLGVDDEIIEVLQMQELYHNLKTAIKAVYVNRDDDEAFYPHDKYGKNEMLRIVRDKDFQKLPVHAAKVAPQAFDLMLTTGDGQRLDMVLDKACLDAIEAIAASTKDQFLADYAELRVATTCIRIAVRGAITKRSRAQIEDALSPNRTLDVKRLAVAAATGIDAVYELLEKIGFKEAVEALKNSFSSFEKWCDDTMMDMIRSQKFNIESSGPIVAYYLAKQCEIRTARIIMTAKQNGFGDDIISERIRKMYG
ncbi:MAG: V-type ATPase subunit [Eubacterium sp.]|nr:V-type ATPase subunit [Eubacterium sp.]